MVLCLCIQVFFLERDRETSYRWHTNGANGIAQSAVASNTHVRSPGSRILFKTLPPVRKSISRKIAAPRGPAPVGKTPSSLDQNAVGRFVCSNAAQPCRRRIEVVWQVAVGASNPHLMHAQATLLRFEGRSTTSN